jgi:3-methylcrotonyl-CoA carboxylase beta subunit
MLSSSKRKCVDSIERAIVCKFSRCNMADDLKFDNTLESKLDLQAPRFKANREALTALMAALRAEEDSIRLGGGAKAAEAQRAKGRLTVRERLKLLLDSGTELLELGLWAAYGMYGEYAALQVQA